jgi:hypothetical protein
VLLLHNDIYTYKLICESLYVQKFKKIKQILYEMVELGRGDLAGGSGFMTYIARTTFRTHLQNEKNHSLAGVYPCEVE